MNWQKYESVYYRLPLNTQKLPSHIALAGFDLDSTLIISDKGERYAIKSWLWAYDKVPETLMNIYEKGYTLIIFSNRKNGYLIENTMDIIEQIINLTKLPIYAFLATAEDEYRKPNIGMLNLFKQLTNVSILDPLSFYCGDAAGSEAIIPAFRWSDADINFAKNVNLKFYLPTEIFPTFSPTVPSNIKLMITMGHGWENMFTTNTTYTLPDGRTYSVDGIGSVDIKLVLGENATPEERDVIRTSNNVSQKDTLILYFPNYGQIKGVNKNPKIDRRKETFVRVN